MKNKNDIDELYQEKLQNYEKDPPAYLLENILAASAVNKRSRKLFLWRYAGVAAALLLAFIAGWQFNARHEREIKHPALMTQNPVSKTEPETIIPAAKNTSRTKAELLNLMIASSNRVDQAKSSKSINTALVPENELVSITNESILLTPIHLRFNTIPSETSTINQLQVGKTKSIADEWTEKSIDQQIMEQNEQLALAQNQEKQKGRWLVGAQVSPAYSVTNSSHSTQYASNMLTAETGKSVDLGAGLSVEYKPGKRWSVQSGVYYSGLVQSSGISSSQNSKNSFTSGPMSDYQNTNVNVDANTNKISMNSAAGVIEFKSIPSQLVLGSKLESNSVSPAVFTSQLQFTQSFQYIEIPLYFRYAIIDSRFGVEMMGGFSSNLLVGNQTYMESNSGKSLVGTTSNMEPVNYSGTMGVGLKYSLSTRFFLNVEPRVKYYLNSLNSNSAVSYKPYTIGIFTGLSYQF